MTAAMAVLAILNLLVNGDFSQGLQHWQASDAWSVKRGKAILVLDNAGGSETRGDRMCSDPVSIPNGAQRLSGAARVNARSSDANGYVFLGVRWYDAQKRAMYDHSITTTEGKPLKRWINYAFSVSVPYDDYRKVKYVSLCFISGAYDGRSLRARVDDASLK